MARILSTVVATVTVTAADPASMTAGIAVVVILVEELFLLAVEVVEEPVLQPAEVAEELILQPVVTVEVADMPWATVHGVAVVKRKKEI